MTSGWAPSQPLNWIQRQRNGGPSTPVTFDPPHEGNSASSALQPELYEEVSGARTVGDAISRGSDGLWFVFKNVAVRSSWNKGSLSYKPDAAARVPNLDGDTKALVVQPAKKYQARA